MMAKTVTIRIDDELYHRIKTHAMNDNRHITNFIETATINYLQQIEFVDEFEMEEIKSNRALLQALDEGHHDARHRKGTKLG
jgi:predicted transcriptional regulator